MDNELLNNISKILDEKLTPIYKEIELIKSNMNELKLDVNTHCQINNNNNEFLQDKINKDLDYIKGYYYNRTQ